jgi:16S rRNA processing protein RimM
MSKVKRLIIGKIVGTHGIGGTIKVYSYAQSPSFFHSGRVVFGHVGKKDITTPITIVSARPHKGVVLLSLKGIHHIDDALPLVGTYLYCDASMLPVLDEGEYYWHELIGLSVYHISGEYLGRVESILATGSNDVYVIKNKDNPESNEVLIPAVASFVKEVDVKQGILRVELPEFA